MSSVTIITDAEFSAEVLQAKQPVLVYFWAAWCGHLSFDGSSNGNSSGGLWRSPQGDQNGSRSQSGIR